MYPSQNDGADERKRIGELDVGYSWCSGVIMPHIYRRAHRFLFVHACRRSVSGEHSRLRKTLTELLLGARGKYCRR